MNTAKILKPLALNSKGIAEIKKEIEAKIKGKKYYEAFCVSVQLGTSVDSQEALEAVLSYGMQAIDGLLKTNKSENIKQITIYCQGVMARIRNINHFYDLLKIYDTYNDLYSESKNTEGLKVMLMCWEGFYSALKLLPLADDPDRLLRVRYSVLIEKTLIEQLNLCYLADTNESDKITNLLGQHHIEFAFKSQKKKDSENLEDWKKAAEYQEKFGKDRLKRINCYEQIIFIEQRAKSKSTETIKKLIGMVINDKAYDLAKLAHQYIGLAHRTKSIENWNQAIDACDKVKENHDYDNMMWICHYHLGQLLTEEKTSNEKMKQIWQTAAHHYFLLNQKNSGWKEETVKQYVEILKKSVEIKINPYQDEQESQYLKQCEQYLKDKYGYFQAYQPGR